jgi:hypothetical protein
MKAFAVPIICLALAGCSSGNLSRDAAKGMIEGASETHFQDKIIYPITLGLTASCPESANDPMLKLLIGKGLIKVTQPSDLELTDAGKKFFEAEGEKLYGDSYKPGCDIAQLNVVLGHRGPVEITGIVLSENAATVEYIRHWTLTPIGEEFAAYRKSFNLDQRISWQNRAAVWHIPEIPDMQGLNPEALNLMKSESYKAVFLKYDDGWRLKSSVQR